MTAWLCLLPRGAAALCFLRSLQLTGPLHHPGHRDGLVTLGSLPDDAPPDDPLLADERFCWLPGLAFGDGSMSRQRANRVHPCVFSDLREETQDRLENFCGKHGIPNAKHGLYCTMNC
jgi:hypothetical protein